jgi:hypothetical protein
VVGARPRVHELRRKSGKAAGIACRISGLEHDVLAFKVAEFAKVIDESFSESIRRGETQDADSPDFCRLLPLGGERRRAETEGEVSDERSPVHHSIT